MAQKHPKNLADKIARLGADLAARHHSVEADLVLAKKRVRNLAVCLNATDVVLLDDLEFWARQNGQKAGFGTILKAGLRLFKKDEQSLHVLRQVMENDGRRRPRERKQQSNIIYE